MEGSSGPSGHDEIYKSENGLHLLQDMDLDYETSLIQKMGCNLFSRFSSNNKVSAFLADMSRISEDQISSINT